MTVRANRGSCISGVATRNWPARLPTPARGSAERPDVTAIALSATVTTARTAGAGTRRDAARGERAGKKPGRIRARWGMLEGSLLTVYRTRIIGAGDPRAMRWPAGLRALGYRDFRLFWAGQLVSLVGTWMQTVGQS